MVLYGIYEPVMADLSFVYVMEPKYIVNVILVYSSTGPLSYDIRKSA